jgi:Lipid A 3-O-deacylase (PagL)
MRLAPAKLGCLAALAFWAMSTPLAKAGLPPDNGSEQGQVEIPSDCWLAPSPVAAQATPWDADAMFVAPAGDCEWSLTDSMWLQLTAGAVFSPTHGIGPHDEPTLDLAPVDVRLGLMLNDPNPDRPWLGGVFDFILDLTTQPVIDGYGHIVVGPAALLRYDYVRPGWWLIPYVQGGAGLVYNDCYEDPHQNTIGQGVEFLLRADLGVHFPIGLQWSIDAEFDFEHISNARLADRNAGLNGLGASIGLTYFFRR